MRSVRLFYKKTGNMKFVSHLDMNRFMIRMIRMSKIPVWYSEGFNPHPYITFALPLSLGFESEYDILDFRLDDDAFSNENVVKSLSPLMPDGIEIISCEEPIMKTKDISFADFYIDFSQDISEYEGSLDAFLSADVIEAEKKTKKGGTKTINLKEYLKGWCFEDKSIKFTLAAGGSNNLNPKLLLDTFCKANATDLPPYSVRRGNIYNSEMVLFK